MVITPPMLHLRISPKNGAIGKPGGLYTHSPDFEPNYLLAPSLSGRPQTSLDQQNFRIHHRLVARLRESRIFIAGDAAHIHRPFGGQGMNTGLHDVWNLVWKIDPFLHGHGNEQLLDSYSAGRLPVIKNVIQTMDLLTKAMGTPHKVAQALRDTVIPRVSRLAPFQHAFVRRLSELGIAYHGSPIVEGDGKRYFDDSLRGGKGILSRFILVLHNDADSSTKRAAEQLTGSFTDIVELRLGARHNIALVRPDGYIAYSAPRREGNGALRSVRSLSERQTNTQQGTHAA